MATELTDGDILLYTLNARYQGQRIINTWHYKVSQFTPELIDYEDAANAILNDLEDIGGFIDKMEALTVTGYSFIDHRIQRVYPVRNRAIVQTLSTTGAKVGTGSTVNQAAVITKYGNVAARYGVGSWHQAGLGQDSFAADGTIEIVDREALLDAVDDLQTGGPIPGFATTSLVSVLWNVAVPARVTPIQECVPQSTARVMRRRTVGVGI